MTTYTAIDDKKFTLKFVTSQFKPTTDVFSSQIEYYGLKWCLNIYNATGVDKKEYLAVFLYCEANKSNLWSADVSASMNLKKTNGGTGETKTFNRVFDLTCTALGWRTFIDIPTLTSPYQYYIKDGQITIECTVTIKSAAGVQPKKTHNFEIKDPVLSDAVLNVDGKKFYANKGFLSTHSSVFKTLFYPNNYGYSHTSEQKIDNAKHGEFEQFLQCIYSAQNVDKNNIVGVLKLASRFEVHLLMDQCEKFLISSADFNKSTKLNYAETYKLSNLQLAVLDSIKDKTDTELKSLTSNIDSLGDATVRALLKKIGDIAV